MSIRQVWWLTCYSAWNVFFFFISTISFTVASRTNNCLYESVPVFVTRMVSLLKDKSLGELWSYIFCVLRMCASVAVWWISLVKLWLYVCLPGTWSECRCATCYYCVWWCAGFCVGVYVRRISLLSFVDRITDVRTTHTHGHVHFKSSPLVNESFCICEVLSWITPLLYE